jgi:transposase
LLPAAVRTYAPRGQTPILKYRPWEHLSVISAITPQGKLYTMIQDETFKGADIVRFLKHLLRHIPGKLLIVWDGLPAHRSQPIKEFLRQGAARRIHLEQLPGYAPELNPDEAVWNYLKNVELKNLCCHHLQQLRRELRKAIARLRYKIGIILSFFRQARLGHFV